MPVEVLSLKDVANFTPIVARCVEALRAGKLAVFPTETVYGLGALASNSSAVRNLCVQKGRRSGHALPLVISGADVLTRYAPNVDASVLRVARRFWPGPLTLVLDGTDPRSELFRLPEDSRRAIMPEGTVGIRVPQNDFLLELLRALDEPLVLTSANLTGESPAANLEEAQAALGTRLDLFVDGGPSRIGRASTVVKISDERRVILREGAVTQEQIEEAAKQV